MLALQVPCRVTDGEQLRAKLGLLEDYKDTGYQFGIEIVGPWNDFFSLKNVKVIQKSLRSLPESLYLSLHAPYDARVNWKRNFFSSDKGFTNLLHVFYLADFFGVHLVNLHASLFCTNDELRKISAAGNLEIRKRELIERVGAVLAEAHSRYPQQKICLENMPYCWDHDLAPDPNDMIYETCFVDLKDFLSVVNPGNNIFATVDTCHLAAVYDSSQLLGEIKQLGGGLQHVHFTDIKRVWQPFVSLAEEGVVPGEGRIGEKIFKELLRYFSEFSLGQDLSIVLEINDKNLIELTNLKTSLKKTVGWLDELRQSS
ncbi:MAG: TIM barrel protein [Candidatus Nealsonbacteria bacterium]|nr:TIM barrel protein [Candidatus Nealsonbacteria bacterium]